MKQINNNSIANQKQTVLELLQKALKDFFNDRLFDSDIVKYRKTSDNAPFFKTACCLAYEFLRNYDGINFDEAFDTIYNFTLETLSHY